MKENKVFNYTITLRLVQFKLQWNKQKLTLQTILNYNVAHSGKAIIVKWIVNIISCGFKPTRNKNNQDQRYAIYRINWISILLSPA